MFLVCQILITSLFNRSTTKKAKKSGTVAFRESPSVAITYFQHTVYLCTCRFMNIHMPVDLFVGSKFVIFSRKK